MCVCPCVEVCDSLCLRLCQSVLVCVWVCECVSVAVVVSFLGAPSLPSSKFLKLFCRHTHTHTHTRMETETHTNSAVILHDICRLVCVCKSVSLCVFWVVVCNAACAALVWSLEYFVVV